MTQLSSIFLLFISLNLPSSFGDPVVWTKYGMIQGHFKKSFTNKTYEAYEGIPFAQPPIGSRRFKPPEPPNSWSGVLPANRVRGPCNGFHHSSLDIEEISELGGTSIGLEDCLYLNVYVPINKIQPLPVIFWIYGGGFQAGSVNGYEQQYLIDKNVIFVSSNYRHGILGFMSTEDEVITGNMGLKDQSLALRWVHENIRQFGGDPYRITLVGNSAGAASVHYHYLSPMSAGLFHSGISLSGTALNPWSLSRNPRERAFKLAKHLNCNSNDTREMVRCLRNIPANDLMKAQSILMLLVSGSLVPFAPVVEKHSRTPFMTQTPWEIMRRGGIYDVPWITGIVNAEGDGFVADYAKNAIVLEVINKAWTVIAPHILFFDDVVPSFQHKNVSETIRKHYFGEESINYDSLGILSNAVGDRLFSVDAQKAAMLQAMVNKSPVWFYYYAYKGGQSDTRKNNIRGATHGEDANLVLGSQPSDQLKTMSDKMMRRDLGRMWTAFASQGAPNFGPRWGTVRGINSKLNYLNIKGPGQFHMLTNSNLGQKLFWDSIDFFNHGVKYGVTSTYQVPTSKRKIICRYNTLFCHYVTDFH